MASDLSKIIQESITLTLNGLLAKDASITQVTKTHIKDIQELQLLKVESVFEFSNFTSQLSFLVPARSSSLIFNTMMGSPITDLAEELDDDAVDAIGEFISNTSGTLTTAINGENFQDIGQTKFNIANKEIIDGNTNDLNLDNTYRFLIDLEGNELIVFILFDEPILEYIKEISQSEITHHEEEIEEVEEIIEEVEEIKEEPKIEIEEVSKIEEISEKNQEIKTDEKENSTNKDKKLKIIVFGLGGLLGFIIITFLAMFFMGIFDPEPVSEKKVDINTTQQTNDKNQLDIIKYDTLKKVNFKTSDINKARLNNKLTELTKFKVLNKEELEAQKLAEKNRLFELEKEKELLAFSKRNQEETLFIKEEPKQPIVVEIKTQFQKETFPIKKNKVIIDDNITSTIIEKNVTKQQEVKIKVPKITQQVIEKQDVKLNYVITNSLKYSLFKDLVQQTNTKQARISICNNENGKTAIYIGPFETLELQNKMLSLVKEKNTRISINSININEEEFNARCNLE